MPRSPTRFSGKAAPSKKGCDAQTVLLRVRDEPRAVEARDRADVGVKGNSAKGTSTRIRERVFSARNGRGDRVRSGRCAGVPRAQTSIMIGLWLRNGLVRASVIKTFEQA